MERFELAYKNVLVIGAGGGIGAVVTERLAKAGARLVLLEDETRPGAAAAQLALANVRQSGGDGIFLPCNILDSASCADAVQKAREQGYDLDAMVFVAGVVETRSILECEVEEILNQVNLHVCSVARFAKLLVPRWKETKHGCAIVMTSIAGELPAIGKDPYNASKGAAIALTLSLAAQFGHQGIRFVPILANRIGTKSALERAAASEAIAREMVGTQLSHQWIKPEEVAGTIDFLLTREARAFNGDRVYLTDGANSALAARPTPPQ